MFTLKIHSLDSLNQTGIFVIFFLKHKFLFFSTTKIFLMTSRDNISDDKSIVGFFPENSDEPSVVCFNTGLLSNKVEPVFALLTPNKYRQGISLHLCNPSGENEAYYLTEFKTSGQLQNKFLMQKLNADPVPTYLLPRNSSPILSLMS